MEKKQGNGLAIASIILGIIGLVGSMILFGLIPAIIGLILGIISLAKKHDGKGLAIVGIVICALASAWIIFLIVVGLVVTSNKPIENTNTVSGSIESEDASEDIESLVDIKAVPTENGLMCVFITNNSSQTIGELDFQINYKDDQGQTIDYDEDGHDAVLPGTTVVSRLEAPETYSDYEIVKDIAPEDNASYKNHSNEISLSSNQGEGCIIVEATNNSDITIEEMELIAVLYDGDKIASVEYPEDIMNITPGQTVTQKFEPDTDVKYDRFEIYLNQAHTF